MAYFFGNIFPKLTSSVCNTIQAKLLCSRILRFKCVEIFEDIGILSERKDRVHNIRRLANKVFINLNQKKFNAFLVNRFFICILLESFKFRSVVLQYKAQAVLMYVGSSAKGTFCTKHPYQRTVGKLRFNKGGKYKLFWLVVMYF